MENRVPGISRLIVKKIDEERKTTGGIIFADTFESTTQMVQILAVGEVKGNYVVGSTAYIPRHTGIEIDVDDLVVLEGDILFSIPSENLTK